MTASSLTTNLEYALAYAARGWPVFPVPPGTKAGYWEIKEEFSGTKWGATRDPVLITRYFTRWPDAGIGLMCGAESGVFVLDVDTPEGHGVDGFASLAALEAEHGPLPPTLMSGSPTGSRHHLYKYPTDGGEIRNRHGKIAPGLDIKGAGGMVVLPPTRKGDGCYRWLNDLPIAPAPEWLIALARRDNHRTNGGDHPIEFPDGEPDAEVDLDKLACAMTVLPNMSLDEVDGDTDDPRYFDYDRWLAVLMALHRSFGGDPEGFRIVCAWTEKNPDEHDKEHITARTWKGFNDNSGPALRSKVREVTAKTVYHFANLAAPGWDDDYNAEAERRVEAANRNDDYMMAEIAAALAAEGKSLETAVAEAACANAGAGASHVRTLSPRKARGSSTDADVTPPGAGATCTSINTNTNNAPNNGNAGADAKPAVAPPDDEPASAAPNASKPSDAAATQAGAAAEPASAAPKVKATTKAVKPTGRPTLTALPLTLAEAGGGFDRDQIVNGVNRRHALVLAGNKAAVMKFEADGKTFRLISVDAFKTWHLNRAITLPGDNGKPKRITHAELWLNDRDRREFEGIEFAPAGARKGYYNLWQGFAVEPRPGDCGKFLAHIRDNIAQGNTFLYNWVVGFFAQIAQQPDVKIGTALALRGEPGVGKTKVGEVFGSLLKPHYKLVADPRFVTGQFNSHMASLLLLHADEAFWAGDKRSEGKLKDLVTGSEHFLEFKGVDPISVRNLIRLFVTGNSDWLVPAAFRERRWAVIDAGVGKIQDHAYFAAIDYEMDHGGREALLHHLLHFDLKTVNLRAIPETKALLEQKFASASPEEKFWLDTLKNGKLPGSLEGEPNACRKKALYDAYIRHARRTGVSHRSIETKVGMFLSDHVPGLIADQKVTHTYDTRLYVRVSKQVPAFKFPTLEECRKAFADKIKQAVDWGADVDDWQVDEDEEGDGF